MLYIEYSIYAGQIYDNTCTLLAIKHVSNQRNQINVTVQFVLSQIDKF